MRERAPTHAGQVCHGNATLSQLDVSRLYVRCAFPFGELAAFGSLNTLYLSVHDDGTSIGEVWAASTTPQPGLSGGQLPCWQAVQSQAGLHMRALPYHTTP